MVTKESLQAAYGEVYMMEYYLGAINFKKNCVNPIRPSDRTPSGRFYLKGDKLNYKDFASPKDSFDVYKYVQVTFNLNFKEAITRIALDLNHKPSVKKRKVYNEIKSSTKQLSKSKEFIIKHRRFNDFDFKCLARGIPSRRSGCHL